MDTPTFIAKAKEKWGDRFGYDRCGPWRGAKVHFEIYCTKCEKYFRQTPDKHLTGNGCKTCKYKEMFQPLRRTLESFLERASEQHGTKYDYSRVINPTNKTLIEIGCHIHGWFKQRALVHLRGSGCNDCGNMQSSEKQMMTIEEFIERCETLWPAKFDFTKTVYLGYEKKVKFECSVHGTIETTPASMFHGGHGCPKCGIEHRTSQQTSSTTEFIAKANGAMKYDYSEVEYVRANKKVTIRCLQHDYKFQQTPNKHLMGDEGCPKCQRAGYSKKQIAWLTFVEETTPGGPIQHKLSGGEFRIPGTRFHADGWRPETNTVYEFHGDLWHAHPDHPDYKQGTYHPCIKDKTWDEVYRDTLKKEQKIRELGFNLVVIWESEWDRK